MSRAAICILIAVILWPVSSLASRAAATVKGRIELANSKLKSRDAGSVVIWLKPVDGPVPRSPSKQRKIVNQRDKRFLPHVVADEAGSEVDGRFDRDVFHLRTVDTQ